MKVQNLIVGVGIAGSLLARRLAEEKNEEVLIIDRRNHIGGYCYDYRNKEGILIHEFGPHIFRTDNSVVWNYLSRFTKWHHYQHKVLAYVNGHFLPMPINLDTINMFLGTKFSSVDAMDYLKTLRIEKTLIASVKDVIESQIGVQFYSAFFENYTKKQWGEAPENLPKEIVSRIPIRTNCDNRYFTTRYQAMPEDGYTSLINNLLDHPKIKILLNTDFKEISTKIEFDSLYYSGSIDEYYGYCYGKLPYRCVNFDVITLEKEFYQPVAVVNYPNDYDYTRITEYKHFYDYQTRSTVIAREYSSELGDPSYPIPKEENIQLYEKYKDLNKTNNVHFIGRLGQYKYYSMDQIVSDILAIQI